MEILINTRNASTVATVRVNSSQRMMSSNMCASQDNLGYGVLSAMLELLQLWLEESRTTPAEGAARTDIPRIRFDRWSLHRCLEEMARAGAETNMVGFSHRLFGVSSTRCPLPVILRLMFVNLNTDATVFERESAGKYD